ncbi:hypothetical protein AAC387_Pa10g2160 [Persea americana]
MAKKLVNILFFFHSLLTITCSEMSPMQVHEQRELKRKEKIFSSPRKEHFNRDKSTMTTKTAQHVTITPPTTNAVTRVMFQATNPTATIVTIPSTDPTPLIPIDPVTTPVSTPITVPTTQPVTNPAPTNPVPSSGRIPTTTTSPVDSGQIWCVAKAGALDSSLQVALDYACGSGGADCTEIQPTGNCYFPNTIHNHASYAFNSYYQNNPVPFSCEFGGTAMLVNLNPSSGSCIFLSSSYSSSSSALDNRNPTSSTPIYGSGTTFYSDSVSTSVDLQFLVTFILLTTSCIMWEIDLPVM